MLLVIILCYWYRHQRAQVRWGSSLSDAFPVLNGVEQGGILSPTLFNFHIDELSGILNCLPIGCKLGSRVINHMAYADDLVLLCPYIKGLQCLLSTCQAYGKENDSIKL